MVNINILAPKTMALQMCHQKQNGGFSEATYDVDQILVILGF
jgi:hypothetical protein